MPGLLPVAAIIPVHAVTQFASNASRALFGWRHIDPRLIAPFVCGALAGAAFGAGVYRSLALDWLPALIGVFILLITWAPLPGARGAGGWALALLGFYQSGLGMVVGATGPLGGALLASRGLQRDELVVNTAVYMTSSHGVRIAAFGLMGFAFAEYLWLMLGMVLAVIAGSWLGTRLRRLIPEIDFRFWFRLAVSVLAVRMILITLW
jgi:uncharacterized membrane protein YfcA